MIKRYHLPALLFFLIATSLTLVAQKSVYTFPFENNYRLPPMETFINAEEIATTYQTLGNLYTTEITGLGEEPMEQTSSTFISDVNAIDAVRFLKFYMEEQLIAPGDQTSGSVEMSIIYYNKRSRVNLGTALNVLTLGLGTLLGIPFSTGITDVEVEASFFDASSQYIVSHRGVGQSKKLETLYNIASATRVPHQKALKRALEDLNNQIMADSLIAKVPF
jgi:hypothetical protein